MTNPNSPEQPPLNLDQPEDAPASTPTVAASKPAEQPPLRMAPAAVTPGASRADDDGFEIDVRGLMRAVYKRRYLVLSVFVLVVGSVAAWTFTTVPVYEARTRLLIEAENPNVVSFQEVINEQETRDDYNQTQYNLLTSRSLARRTIETLNLWEHPRFSAPPQPSEARTGVFGWVDTSVEWAKSMVGMGDDTPSLTEENSIPGADETAQQSGVIDAFLGGLSVAPLRNSRMVDVHYRSPDPILATRIANAVATAYIAQNLEYKFMASKEATDWLGERLAEQRDQVQRAELALQRYREQNDAISFTDRENIVVQKLTDLNAAVTRAKTVRIERESVYNQLQTSRNDPALLDTFPAILANSFIQGLKTELAGLQRQRTTMRETFLDSHPRMIDLNSAIQTTQTKLDAEIQKVVMSVKSELDAALAQERSLMQALNQQKSEALGMNEKYIEYSVLDREAQSSKQLYDSLMQRAKETGVSGELRTSNIRVVDPAEHPRSPVLPNTRLNLLSGLAGGALLAVMLAVGFDLLDSRIKSPEEIETYLGLPHLGMLPLMAKAATGGRYVRLDGTPPANFSEAFRTVRTNVLFSSAAEGGQSLIVTSTGPGEGKSVVASNLAISLALAGRRTLLIDADMRKPKVQDVFSVDAEPGLSNLLVGEAKASACVRKVSTSELWVLPAGKIPPNPAELLGSKRCLQLLESLKSHFEWIIIDTPPVMAVADVSVLAHAVNGTLFVVGSEMTSRHAAKQAVHQLRNVQARVLGVVLNRVDLERNAYYYSQYYRREYTAYYVKQGD